MHAGLFHSIGSKFQSHCRRERVGKLLVVVFLVFAGTRFEAGASTNRVEVVVAADGSGDYTNVQSAVDAAPQNPARPYVIRIKPGIYKELIYVQREKRFLRFIGEDAAKTVLTFDLSARRTGLDGKPLGTFRTPSTLIDADDFAAENITFENSSGTNGQALAIRFDGDRAVFRHCRFLGWQDTVLANRGRQYFEDCYIAGHVDFIFGAATAFFQRCELHCRGSGYITAASTPREERFGFVFSNYKITGESGAKTYLGRPWRADAAVAFLNTEMSIVVRAEGWNNWGKPEREATVRYAEYKNFGPGSEPTRRVAWAKQLPEAEAKAFTAANVLRGNYGWNPQAK